MPSESLPERGKHDRYLLIVERNDIGVAYFGPYPSHGAALRAAAKAESLGYEWNVEYLGSPRELLGVPLTEEADGA